MNPRFSRVRLVDFSGTQYRTLLDRMATFRKPKGAGPTSRDLFSKDAERTLRRWLSGHLDLTMLRIIHYFERIGVHHVERYREVDGVGRAGDKLLLFEIKTGHTRASVRQGIAQLTTAREILGTRFPNIITCLLVVDTDDDANSEIAHFVARAEDLRLIGSLDDLTTDGRPHVLRFSVDDVTALSHVPVHL
ncbi:MAG: hypothetical protein WA208_19240, partial [Thermoanaerobaculia bacterium]